MRLTCLPCCDGVRCCNITLWHFFYFRCPRGFYGDRCELGTEATSAPSSDLGKDLKFDKIAHFIEETLIVLRSMIG